MKKLLILISFSLLFLTSCSDNQTSVTTEQTIEQKIDGLLGQMTLLEKIGQMTQPARDYLEKESDIKDYALGSILSGGGSGPAVNTPSNWADMHDRYQAYAMQSRLKIPIIYGIDAVHGHNNVKGATIFPHHIGLGATHDADLVQRSMKVAAEEISGTGIRWTFAPCIAVTRNERWGRTYESFSENTSEVNLLTTAAIVGFQGSDLSATTSVAGCAKHFLGDGGTDNGKDQGNTVADEATVRSLFLPPYQKAIEAKVATVMASYNSINGYKMHGSKYWLTDVLKTELKFDGFVVTDWAGINQLPGSYKTQIISAINAGIDMVMLPSDYKTFIIQTKAAVDEGSIPISRIDDAVRRILRVKYKLGLFDHPYADRALTAKIGSADHRAVAREAVRKSAVLLKNNNTALPLNKQITKLAVAGVGANDIGMQCGGWTIWWQGGMGDLTPGTTILQGIKSAVSSTTTVQYSADGSGLTSADAAIVVIGEQPYAEGAGDRTDLSISAEDKAVINRVKALGCKVIVVMLSGRPMIISDVLNNVDAFVCAWLPGTEANGISDLLFGDYDFTGTLSFTFPKTMSQIPINKGDANYDPLFPTGFGLKYAKLKK